MPDTGRPVWKLAVGIGSIISLMAGLLFLALRSTESMETSQREILLLTEKIDLATAMREAVRKRAFSLAVVQTLDDYFDRDTEYQRFQGFAQEYVDARDKLFALGAGEREQVLIQRFQTLVREGRDTVERAMMKAVESNGAPGTANLLREATVVQTNMFAQLSALVDLLRAMNRGSSEKASESSTRARHLLYGLGLLIWLVAAGIAALVIARERGHMSALLKENRERRQAEMKLRDLNASLEKRVEQRTAELRHAKEDAEFANEAKGQFLRSMSHELRTPLNAVMGFAQLLLDAPDRPLDALQTEQVDFIMKAGEHLLDLVNQVLELNKIEAGMTQVSPTAVEARPLIDDCLRLCRAGAKGKSVQVVDRTADVQIPTLWTDRMRLKQILLNLLSNSMKYNRSNGTVTIDFSRVDGMARLSVIDTGMGIPAHRQNDVFTPFERLGRETGEIQGTGVGLAITKHLVSLLGGRIGFSSDEGTGSTFWVDVPVCVNGSGAEAERPARGGPDGATVLYVEENPATQHLIELILGRIPNLRILSAANAETGIAIARKEQPDLILMDICLPDMSATEATMTLRAGAETRHIPIIAIASNAPWAGSDIGKQAEFHAYLTTPLDVAATLRAVEQTIGG